MKICDITQSYTVKSGGIRTYIEAKKKHIRESTNWEHVLIMPGEKDHVESQDRSVTYEVSGQKIPKCDPYRFTFRLDKIMAILEKEKPDIIELGSGYILPWTAFEYRKRHRAAVIGFYHTDYPNAYVKTWVSGVSNNRLGSRLEELAYKYVRMVYNRCDETVVCSANLQKKLENNGVRNVKTIPLGVDFELFSRATTTRELRQRFLGRNAKYILIYAGRFDVEKRPDFLVDAFQRIPHNENFSLLLVGDGPLRETLIEKAAGKDNLFVLPYQNDKNELAKLLNLADIYVTAGAHETFGLSVLEAQASGLPVVGVKAGALIERVQDSFGILTDVNSPEDMAHNIYKLSQNGLLKKGKDAQEYVKNHYTWTVLFNNLFQFYHTTFQKYESKNEK